MSRKRKESDSTLERGVPSYSNEKGESVSIGNVYIGDNCWETVFRYLDQTEDRLSVLLTCKRWNEMGTRFLDPSVNHNYAIRWSSVNGRDEAVELLLGDWRVDPASKHNFAILMASGNGYDKVVKLLLGDWRVDPAVGCNQSIQVASENGHDKVVKLLLGDERADPTDCDNIAIRWASRNGHDKVVKLLLEDGRVDPVVRDKYRRFALPVTPPHSFLLEK